VTSTKQKSTFIGVGTVRRSITVPVPYCEPCHHHVLWSSGPGLVGVALMSVLLFIGAAVIGAFLGMLVITLLSQAVPGSFSDDPSASGASMAVLLGCILAGGVLAVVIYARGHVRHRPRGPLGPEHFSQSPSAAVVDFSPQGLTLEVYNPRYAALMTSANEPPAPTGPSRGTA
jgi:hypothetical protein